MTRDASLRPVVHVVEDDRSVRTALVRLLEAAGYATREYGSAAEFLVAGRKGEPACVVLDIGLPGMTGIELHAALRRAGDATPVIFLTGRGDIHTGVEAMKAGAVDFLTKPVRRAALLTAIEDALARDERLRTRDAERSEERLHFDHLTPREREVFSRVAEGKLNKQIADELGTSVRTIKAHRAQVMSKMQAESIADLVRMAGRLSDRDAP
jgi:FixJ family two-component response regulator